MLECEYRLAFDGHVSDFIIPTLEHDDAHVMAQSPNIFVNHHYFPTLLPRERHVFVTSLYQVLYDLGFEVLDYLLQFYEGKLSKVMEDMYAWAVKSNRVTSPDAHFVQCYLEYTWGQQHALHSLARYMLTAARLRRACANVIASDQNHAISLSDEEGSQSYRSSERVAVL